MNLSLVIPALNEAGNLGMLLPVARDMAAKLAENHEVIVVDGGSTDGTADTAAKLGAQVVRQTEPGYGGALKAGFAAAQGDYIATMDADFSHRPEFLRRMWNMRDRAEVIIASRYVEGGRADMPWSRLGKACSLTPLCCKSSSGEILKFPCPELLELDISDLSPEEVATRIAEHIASLDAARQNRTTDPRPSRK